MPSMEKIHSILMLLREHYRSGLTNREISKILKISPSTCYRILASLKKYDYVCQRKPDMHYFLGFAHLRFAESVLVGIDVAAICLPYLEDLHRQTDGTTFFALLTGKHCIAMEICGHINTRVSVGRGEVMPFYCAASGKVVLSFLPRQEQEEIIGKMDFHPYTKNTIINPIKLREQLDEIHRTGIAYNLQEFNNGISALATPILRNKGRVIGSLAAVGTSVDLDKEQMEEYAELFLEASADVSAKLEADFSKELIECQRSKKDSSIYTISGK